MKHGNDYATTLRLLRAYRLLRSTRTNITQLAKRLGISLRTMNRDISFFRCIGFAVTYDQRRYRITIKRRVTRS